MCNFTTANFIQCEQVIYLKFRAETALAKYTNYFLHMVHALGKLSETSRITYSDQMYPIRLSVREFATKRLKKSLCRYL